MLLMKTTGAKIFSSHGGAPTDRPLLDTQADLYDIQKAQKPPTARFAKVRNGVMLYTRIWVFVVALPQLTLSQAVATNNVVIEEAEAHGVRSYIFAPCIVCRCA